MHTYTHTCTLTHTHCHVHAYTLKHSHTLTHTRIVSAPAAEGPQALMGAAPAGSITTAPSALRPWTTDTLMLGKTWSSRPLCVLRQDAASPSCGWRDGRPPQRPCKHLGAAHSWLVRCCGTSRPGPGLPTPGPSRPRFIPLPSEPSGLVCRRALSSSLALLETPGPAHEDKGRQRSWPQGWRAGRERPPKGAWRGWGPLGARRRPRKVMQGPESLGLPQLRQKVHRGPKSLARGCTGP